MTTNRDRYKAKKYSYWTEPYARGHIACRSTGNDCEYAGVSGSWQSQPIVRDPFATKEDAQAFMDTQPAGKTVMVA